MYTDRRLFEWDHLPDSLRVISQGFQELMKEMEDRFLGPNTPPEISEGLATELEKGVSKLLEAKDCFVRAAVLEAKDKGE